MRERQHMFQKHVPKRKNSKTKNPHDSVPLRRNSVQEEYYSIELTTMGVYSGGVLWISSDGEVQIGTN